MNKRKRPTFGKLPQELESVYGAVTPPQRPEDFQRLRDLAIEEHVASLNAQAGPPALPAERADSL